MKNEDKIKAILQRVPSLGQENADVTISMMMIFNYLKILTDNGLVMPSHDLTPSGKDVVAVCEEFDWKPSDEHIKLFVDDLVNEQSRPAFLHFITRLRDDREGLLKSLKKFKDQRGNLGSF